MDRIDSVIKLVEKQFDIAYKECQKSINWISLWDLKYEIIRLIETLKETESERS